jgi:insertion element IS1 protein InsB
MDFMGACLAAVPKHLPVQRLHCPREVLLRRVEAEADERCSFAKRKATKQWLRLAMDRATRQIIAFHVGERRRDSAQQLWANLPALDREQATFSTDQDEVSGGVIPAARPKAITQIARTANDSERFHHTLRQRVSRPAREPLAFSKKVENHIGAIRYFLCRYNLTRAAALPL